MDDKPTDQLPAVSDPNADLPMPDAPEGTAVADVDGPMTVADPWVPPKPEMNKQEQLEALYEKTHKLVRRPAVLVKIGDPDDAFLLWLCGWTMEEACKYVKVKPHLVQYLYNKRIKCKPGPNRWAHEEAKKDHWRLEYITREAMAHCSSETVPMKRKEEFMSAILKFTMAKDKIRDGLLADQSGLPPPTSPEDMKRLRDASKAMKAKGRKDNAQESEHREPIDITPGRTTVQ